VRSPVNYHIYVSLYLLPSADSPSAMTVRATGMMSRPTASWSVARLRLGCGSGCTLRYRRPGRMKAIVVDPVAPTT